MKVSPENNKCLLTKKELLESEVYILVDKTPFYVNEGGQAFDKGFIQIKGLLFDIFLVKKIRGFVFHVGRLINNDSRYLILIKNVTYEFSPNLNCNSFQRFKSHMVKYLFLTVKNGINIKLNFPTAELIFNQSFV